MPREGADGRDAAARCDANHAELVRALCQHRSRASLALCREHDTPARLEALGSRIEERVRSRLGARAGALNLRRRGGIVALDLAGGRGYLAPAALELRARALERGVLLRPLGEVLYAMPPASTSADQADLVADTLTELVPR